MSFVFGVWTFYLIESYQIHFLQWARYVLVYHLQARDICTPWSDQCQTMTLVVWCLFSFSSIPLVTHVLEQASIYSLHQILVHLTISDNGILSLLSSMNFLKCANIQENFSIGHASLNKFSKWKLENIYTICRLGSTKSTFHIFIDKIFFNIFCIFRRISLPRFPTTDIFFSSMFIFSSFLIICYSNIPTAVFRINMFFYFRNYL